MNVDEDLKRKVNFVIKFAKALHTYGATAHGLEQAMQNVTKTIGLRSQIFASPTVLIASFKEEDSSSELQSITRVSPGAVNLEKMLLLDELGDKVISGQMKVPEANLELNKIISKENTYPKILEILAYIFISSSTVILLGGGFEEFIASTLVGTLIGAYTAFAPKEEGFTRFAEFITAFIASFSTALLFVIFPEFSLDLVVLAGLIIFVPGLSITISMAELATENLVSGTARLMGAIIVFLKMIFGVALGSSLFNLLHGTELHTKVLNPPMKVFMWLALILASISFTVVFKARIKDYPWIFSACFIAICASLSTSGFGANLGAFTSGFIVAAASNLYARFIKKPGAMIFMPGLILLVPGSVGFKGLQFLVEKDTLLGIDTAFQMFFIATALVAGILLANILIRPNRSL